MSENSYNDFSDNVAMIEFLEFEIARLDTLRQITIEIMAGMDADHYEELELYKKLRDMKPPTSAPTAHQQSDVRVYGFENDSMDIELEIRMTIKEKHW